MFLCVSLNPAMDTRLRISKLRLGAVNRASESIAEPGGKAAHVAMALRGLKKEVTWIGTAGGPTGVTLLSGLKALGIHVCAVPVRPPTRSNLAIQPDKGTVTEILEPGNPLSPLELKKFRNSCNKLFARWKSKAIVILSGSLPPGVPLSFYAALISLAQQHKCRVFLDTSGEPLRLAILEHPDLVKPNRDEAQVLTRRVIKNSGSAVAPLQNLLTLGARSAALSLGDKGLLWCAAPGQPVFHARPPKIKGCSAVGSGDSALAGFADAISRDLQDPQVVRWAAACGTANCLAVSPGQIRLSDVRRIARAVRVTRLAPA